MGFYEDIFGAGERFTVNPGSSFKDLGDSFSKFLDLDGLAKSFKSASGLSQMNEAFNMQAGQQDESRRFEANMNSMADKTERFSMAPGLGSEVTGRYRPTAASGGYEGLNAYLQNLGMDIAQKKGAMGLQIGGGITNGTLAKLNSSVDQWDGQIQAASQRFGAPPNLLKALMNLESGGVHRNASGQVLVNGAGAIGLMQIVGGYHEATARSLGLDLYNEADNIAYASYLLSQENQRCGSWDRAVNAYYTGSCETTGARDSVAQGGSGITDSEYTRRIIDTWHQLDGSGNGSLPGGFTGGNVGGGSVNYSSFTSGRSFPVTQELGLTDFARANLGGMYAYGSAYGISGHPGIDIGTPRGTPLTTPWGGTVVCVGEASYGSDQGGGGCGYYGDAGGGTGRVQIRLDNGDHIIFGHTSSTNLRPGQRVEPGQVVALSGTQNGDHVHVEYRKRTPGTTSSGFTVVDISGMIGGGFTQGAQQLTGSTGFTMPGNAWGGTGYDPYKRKSVYFGG